MKEKTKKYQNLNRQNSSKKHKKKKVRKFFVKKKESKKAVNYLKQNKDFSDVKKAQTEDRDNKMPQKRFKYLTDQ